MRDVDAGAQGFVLIDHDYFVSSAGAFLGASNFVIRTCKCWHALRACLFLLKTIRSLALFLAW